jgi:hypothetical protein
MHSLQIVIRKKQREFVRRRGLRATRSPDRTLYFWFGDIALRLIGGKY